MATSESNWLVKLINNRIESRWEESKQKAYKLRNDNPGFSTDQLANLLIEDSTNWAALVGIGVGAVETIPSMGQYIAIASIPSEIVYIVKLELDVAIGIAAIYDCELSREKLEITIVACLAYSLGADYVKEVTKNAAKIMTRKSIEKIFKGSFLKVIKSMANKIGVRITKKGLLKKVPLVAIPVGAAMNYGTLELFGRMTKHFFSPNWKMCGDCSQIIPNKSKFCPSCGIKTA